MSELEMAVRAGIQRIGEESFPEDAVAWRVTTVEEKGGYAFAEAVAEPATVGYPKFRFVLRAGTGGVEVVGCYAFEGGRWSLLFTAPGTPQDWKSLA